MLSFCNLSSIILTWHHTLSHSNGLALSYSFQDIVHKTEKNGRQSDILNVVVLKKCHDTYKMATSYRQSAIYNCVVLNLFVCLSFLPAISNFVLLWYCILHSFQYNYHKKPNNGGHFGLFYSESCYEFSLSVTSHFVLYWCVLQILGIILNIMAACRPF